MASWERARRAARIGLTPECDVSAERRLTGRRLTGRYTQYPIPYGYAAISPGYKASHMNPPHKKRMCSMYTPDVRYKKTRNNKTPESGENPGTRASHISNTRAELCPPSPSRPTARSSPPYVMGAPHKRQAPGPPPEDNTRSPPPRIRHTHTARACHMHTVYYIVHLPERRGLLPALPNIDHNHRPANVPRQRSRPTLRPRHSGTPLVPTPRHPWHRMPPCPPPSPQGW